MKRFIPSVIFILLVATTAIGVIMYSRGYRFNVKEKSVNTTGILSASSYPEKASLFIDGKLITATNASTSLAPGWYTARISKEGYQPWEEKIRIQGEVVTQLDALLVPSNPSLRALTVSGVLNPSFSSDGSKVAFVIPEDASQSASLTPKAGIWTMELRNGALGNRPEPRAIYQPLAKLDWSSAKILWSPDNQELLLLFIRKDNKAKETVTSALRLIADSDNLTPTEVTSIYDRIISGWELDQKEKTDTSLTSLPPTLSTFLTDTTDEIHFSPDDTKILYHATGSATLATIVTPPVIGSNSTPETRSITKGNYYVYDRKEDRNYLVAESSDIADPSRIKWYTDSKNIVMIEKVSIYIIDYDGNNKRAVYTGPFEDGIVYPWQSGGRLIILTSFNNPQTYPNFYEVDLR